MSRIWSRRPTFGQGAVLQGWRPSMDRAADRALMRSLRYKTRGSARRGESHVNVHTPSVQTALPRLLEEQQHSRDASTAPSTTPLRKSHRIKPTKTTRSLPSELSSQPCCLCCDWMVKVGMLL